MNWRKLESETQLDEIQALSKDVAVIIFKHSTSCPISGMAQSRLVNNWDVDESEIIPYHLDLLRHRNISNLIADRFQVAHESPQVLLIRNGECTYENSHLDISAEEIKESLNHKVV